MSQLEILRQEKIRQLGIRPPPPKDETFAEAMQRMQQRIAAAPVAPEPDPGAISEARRKASREYWQKITPEAYWAADDGRDPQLSAIAKNWRAVAQGKDFLMLLGDSRAGKSWACYQALKRDIVGGNSVGAWRTSQLSMKLSTLFRDDPEEHDQLLSDLCRIDVVYLDDLDKAVFTERFGQQLYDIIEARAASFKKTLITANTSPNMLRMMLEKNGLKFADPLVNRIIERGHLVVSQKIPALK
jgi:DNA replication protein DnaC